jgi:sulfite dehydrogenase (cytochrome) subunit B
MKKIILLTSLAIFTSCLQAKTISLPADTVLWRQSDLKGYQLTLQKCSTCHSAHYAEYQPPNTGPAYWNAQVLRMKNVFKGQINDEDVPLIVDYLTKTYGSNRK